jgi:hypothetical protein
LQLDEEETRMTEDETLISRLNDALHELWLCCDGHGIAFLEAVKAAEIVMEAGVKRLAKAKQ